MVQLNVIGNLGFNAKKVTGNFKDFVSFSVAHTEKYTDKNNVAVERTLWINVVINWNCENLLPYLVKGTKVFVSGPIKTRVYNDQNGNPQAGIDLIANTLTLCGSSTPNTQPPAESEAQKQTTPTQSEQPFGEGNSDILPF